MLKKGNLFLSSLGNHLNFEIFVFKWRCSVNTNKALAILIIICISCGTWEFSGSLRNSSNCWAAVKRLSRSVSLVILLTRCDKREPSPNILICSESKTIIPSVHNKSSHKPCSPCKITSVPRVWNYCKNSWSSLEWDGGPLQVTPQNLAKFPW